MIRWSKFPKKKYSYVFIHPTKCGGTAFLEYIHKNKQLNIGVNNKHKWKCSDHPNPIIFLRDPVSRFLSMYNYWKHGSEKYMRTGVDSYLDHYTVDDYINFIETRSTALILGFTWEEHYAPQTNWIQPSDYSKTIVVIYKEDLWPSIKALLEYIDMPVPHTPMGRVNVTNKTVTTLEPRHVDWIRKYYEHDYELLNKTALFRKVIV